MRVARAVASALSVSSPRLTRARTWPVFGAPSGRDEDRGRGRWDIGGMPGAGFIDRVLTRTQADRAALTVGGLLMQDEHAECAQYDLAAVRVHLPRIP